VVVGGVIPDEDAGKLLELGCARVYTPRDHDVTAMVGDMADLVAADGAARR
jgi:(2R)-ethylmalonyl-CoA mutase